MTRILVTNTAPLYNRGSMGRAIGLVECLQKSIPDVHITFWHRFYREEKDIFRSHVISGNSKIELQEHPWYIENGSRPLTALSAAVRGGISLSLCAIQRLLHGIHLPLKSMYQKYDIIVDPNYVESSHGTSAALGTLFNLLNTLHATMSGKPVVVCAATIVPPKNRALRILEKHVLNRATMITLREEGSTEHLKSLGVDKPTITITGDLAFLLSPASTEKIDEIMKRENATRLGGPIVGIGPALESSFAKPEDNVQLMADLADFVAEELGAGVLLVPHTRYDLPLITKTYDAVRNKDRVAAINNLYAADELKGIISLCDAFISLRFHALVAALSLAVPSIGIAAYNQTKFHGIIGGVMAQSDYLIDTAAFNHDSLLAELKSKTALLWASRDSVAEQLKERAKLARASAMLNGELIGQLAAASKTS